MTIVLKNRYFTGRVINRVLTVVGRVTAFIFTLSFCVFLLAACSGGGGSSTISFLPIETIAVVDAQNIWIVYKSELIHIKDGAVAVRQFRGKVASVDFIDKNVGWTLMKSGEVLQTGDGGGNWQEIGKVPSRWSFRPDHRMKFADGGTGWIMAGESIFRTVDGGRTWKDFNVPQKEAACAMVVVDQNEFLAITWSGVVFHTLDGGASWETNELPGRKPNYSYAEIISLDKDGAFWVGVMSAHPVLFVSNDSGKTWNQRKFPAEPGTIRVTSIQFAPDGIGRIVYRRIIETDQPIRSSVAATTDSGETWKLVPIEGVPFEPLRVEFVSETVGFLVGKSDIAMTEDGGTTWKVIYRANS